MAKGFRFMPLGLVRLRNFQLGIWVTSVQIWVQVLTRTRGGCIVHRCQNKNPIERLTSGCEWRHAPEARAEDFGEFWKSQLFELRHASGEDGWLSLARRSQAIWLFVAGATRVGRGGGRWKSQNRKSAYLSPYVEEPLNSKVIKSFVLELRSHKCFSRFLYIYIYERYMSISHIRIWLWYTRTIFSVFGMTWPGIETRSAGLVTNTELIRPKAYYV